MTTPSSTEATEALATKLFTYVRANERDRDYLNDCATRAIALVAGRVGEATVPASVLEGAQLEVAANLYQRRASATGTSNFGDPEAMGNPMRPALDPMTPAWPLLRPYLGPGLA